MKKLMITQLIAALALTVAVTGAEPVFAGSQGWDFRKGFSVVAQQATPAVVFIQVEKEIPVGGNTFFYNDPFDLFGEEFSQRFFGRRRDGSQYGRRGFRNQPRQRKFMQTGQGSGFLISKDGYILTNTHVVGDVDRITVRLADGKEYKAKRIGADPKTEVALIKIDAGKDLPYLKAGDPQKLMTGEWVVAIGNPFGLKETLTVGVVSAKGRSGMGITDYEDFIQTDAAINPGNSGGPLLNVDGEVVGINTAIYSRSGGYMGIGFAVPIDMAMNIKDQLVTTGRVTRGYIGILMNPGELTPELAESFGYKGRQGVLVAEVLKDAPAEKAGLKAGDIITSLNGKKISDSQQFRNEVARIMPKEKAKMTYVRNGKEKTATLVVAPFPEDGEIAAMGQGSAEALLEKAGIDCQDLTEALAEQLGLSKVKEGVVITDVLSGSPAERAGLSAGMVIVEVNRQTVKSVKDLQDKVREGKDDSVLLRIKTTNGSFFKSLKLKD